MEITFNIKDYLFYAVTSQLENSLQLLQNREK